MSEAGTSATDCACGGLLTGPGASHSRTSCMDPATDTIGTSGWSPAPAVREDLEEGTAPTQPDPERA